MSWVRVCCNNNLPSSNMRCTWFPQRIIPGLKEMKDGLKTRGNTVNIITQVIRLRYYMARACKYITRPVIGQYSGPDFPVMPMGITSDVNARLVKPEYRKCESSFDSNSWNDLKVNRKGQVLWKIWQPLCYVRTRKTSGNILPARPSRSLNKK